MSSRAHLWNLEAAPPCYRASVGPAHSASRAGLLTASVHAGEPRRKPDDAVATAVALTSTYSFASSAEVQSHHEGMVERFEYGRYGNPTVETAERKLAALEGAQSAVAFGSGMSAITTTLFALLKSGDHLVISDDGYRRTRQFVEQLGRFGVSFSVARAADPQSLQAELRKGSTKLVLLESPTNPHLRVPDLSVAAQLAHEAGAKLLVDATFATPVNQRPLELGADLVTHSATKYLGGHNDLMAGVLSGSSGLVGLVRDARSVMGGILDPHAAYLLLRGLKTLPLRVEQQNRSALQLARFLSEHPRIESVFYPGLASHPDHVVAQRTMKGFGGLLSFVVRGGLEPASKVVDSVRIPRIAPSLGGVESLIEQPTLMSFYGLGRDGWREIGIEEGLIRYAVGIEDVDDLQADLAQALEQIA